jgi:hypothetical protein
MAKRYDGNPNVAFIDIGSFECGGKGILASVAVLMKNRLMKPAKPY